MSAHNKTSVTEYQTYVTQCTDDQLNAAWWLERRGRNRQFERICMIEAVKRGYTLTKPDVYESRRNTAVPAQVPKLVTLEPRQNKVASTKPRGPAPINTLADHLQEVLSSIPAEDQAQGLSLTELQGRFTGRWRGRCHPGELGEALRSLGWGRHRDWDNKGTQTFAALWYPPSVHELRRQLKDVADTRAFITNIQKELTNG